MVQTIICGSYTHRISHGFVCLLSYEEIKKKLNNAYCQKDWVVKHLQVLGDRIYGISSSKDFFQNKTLLQSKYLAMYDCIIIYFRIGVYQ